MTDNIKSIVEGDLDLYEFLGCSSDASADQIRRLYRKKALQYHPDKQSGNALKFDLLFKIYTVLSDAQLRRQYDSIRAYKIAKESRDQRLDELSKGFKQQLEAKEWLQQQTNQLAKVKQLRDAKVRALAIDGMNRIRQLEHELRNNNINKTHVSFNQLEAVSPPKTYVTFDNVWDKTVVVRWKYKESLGDNAFTADVLQEIMSKFGPIARVSIWDHVKGQRYSYGTVEFNKLSDAYDATQHDYSRSASRWDGTNVRKLASLLRSCEFESDYKDRMGKKEDILTSILEAKKVRYQENIHLDNVLFPFMKKQLLQDVEMSNTYLT